jgi:CHU_C Type IX secretion signal domain
VVYSVDANYNNEFDGKFAGKALPTGNYYYVFKNDTKTFKGNITIAN